MGKTLVIIGNGFDLAHNYLTKATDFENNIDSSIYKDFEENTLSMDWADKKITKWWNEYEPRIGIQLGLIRTADERLIVFIDQNQETGGLGNGTRFRGDRTGNGVFGACG